MAKKTTENIELVETGELSKSLKRLNDSANHADWKRALNHAILMSGVTHRTVDQEKIREALGQS